MTLISIRELFEGKKNELYITFNDDYLDGEQVTIPADEISEIYLDENRFEIWNTDGGEYSCGSITLSATPKKCENFEKHGVRYYSSHRPVSIGTFPKVAGNDILDIVNFDDISYIKEEGIYAYGYIVYSNALSDADADDYDLIKETEVK